MELTSGQTITFATSVDEEVYKFAIGKGDNGVGSPWVGGGYQAVDAVFSVETSEVYTIMIARYDNETITNDELLAFENFFIIE